MNRGWNGEPISCQATGGMLAPSYWKNFGTQTGVFLKTTLMSAAIS